VARLSPALAAGKPEARLSAKRGGCAQRRRADLGMPAPAKNFVAFFKRRSWPASRAAPEATLSRRGGAHGPKNKSHVVSTPDLSNDFIGTGAAG
jgi:hypothetical protein